jgi:hypothetical protein
MIDLAQLEQISRAVDAFDADAVDLSEPPLCVACSEHYRIDDESELSALCHGCAHTITYDLARALLAVLPVVRAAENLLPSAPPRIQYLSVDRVNDWACHECAPGNDFPDKSFRCAPHALIAAFATLRRQIQEGE